MTTPRLRKIINLALLLLLGGTVNGILNTLVIVTSTLAEGKTIKIIHPFLWETTGSLSFASLIPFMILLFSKLPLKKGFILQRIPIYILVTFILGIVHTIIMYYSRIWLYQLLSWGSYDYGYLPYRYVMETLKLSVGFWTVFVIYTLVMINRERQQEKLRTVQLEEQLVKTRLDFLKSQINPHFLFNTLNMISSTMYESVEDADKMIANLSDLLRISLKSSTGVHTLKEELDVLNLYLEIMKARFGDKLQINLDIKEETKEKLIPSFLLQPIIENSIKYGMENLSSTNINVTTSFESNRMLITVSDNGPGIHNPVEDILKCGVGLSNTQERLEGLFGNNFEFTWENLPSGGLMVKVLIPINIVS